MPCGHLNAMRFAQKPLPQPAYSFVHVPKAKKTLENSSLQLINNREAFQTCMAEMLLLSKEAVRRRKNVDLDKADKVVTNSGAKPLSLEYLADRMDVDEVSAQRNYEPKCKEKLSPKLRSCRRGSLALATWYARKQNQNVPHLGEKPI